MASKMTKKVYTPIDLNTIDESTFVKKLKISPRLAKRIIALRPYQSVDQLNRVWGIDSETLTRILPLVSVKSQVAPALSPVEEPLPQYTISPFENVPSIPNTPTSGPESIEEPVQQTELVENEPVEAAALAPSSPKTSRKVILGLVLILLVGAFFRFTGLNWDQNFHQHPDERYITMVADQIRGVSGISAYFDTANSTLNPLKFGSYTYGMLPLFITRMVAEWVKMASYDPITLVGRALSGLFDLAAVLMIFLLGKRLYNERVGLLAAALGAAAVLPIQLSHYFAVDSFSTVFVVASVYIALLAIPFNNPSAKINRRNLAFFALFGFVVGLAGACKVNTLPIFGVIILAGLARLITSWKNPDFRSQLKIILPGWALAALFTFLAFRIFQPYAFSGPGFFGFGLNPRWLEVIREVTNQVAGNSEWPPNHHWTARPVTYGWTNMVYWGLGLPLGLAGWLGWAWAAWRMWKGEWRNHFLPFIWVAAYFIWQNVQFWRYMRYFLPIYPFIILFAAWALLEIWDRTRESRGTLLASREKFSLQFSNLRTNWKGAAGILALAIVLAGTYIYAYAFTRIYTRPITRVTASRWILENIPGPLNLIVASPQGDRSYPVQIINRQVVELGDTPNIGINVVKNGTTSTITSPDVRNVGVNIYFRLTQDEKGETIITEGRLALTDDNQEDHLTISFGDINLTQDQTYYFHYKITNNSQFSFSNIKLSNEIQEDPSVAIDWSFQDQAPGVQEGSFAITAAGSYRINRLVIGQFKQVFAPVKTTFKVSLFNSGDDQNPLVESSQELNFTQPGIRFAPVFSFSPVQITGGKTYLVRYEVIQGGALTLRGAPYTLETGWDDALPLSVDHYDALGGIYTPFNLELYEPDTLAKRESMIKILAESDYIVIPSNRAYDAMPRLTLRYPLTLKYYQALFDCPCSGDAMENRAYGLRPPFKSPLGFDLVATFESPPSIGPFRINDQSADESFTVYDHPKVLIFKKSEDFSIDRVKAILNSVDLDQAVFQTPMAFTRAPTALQLMGDRLAAQTIGGTWSSMFNRTALVNINQGLGGTAWYLALLLLGWMVFPTVFTVFSGLPDRGYPLIRIAGLLTVAWAAWFLGSLKILPFTQITIGLCIALTLALNLVLANHQRKALSEFIRARWKYLLGTEAIFLVAFLFFLSVRLGNPDLWNPWLGGEKPMDFAFFNAVLKAVYFPPENPWFSGHYINYYYFGYVIAAIPTKLLGILPSIAYNLTLPAWFAMTGIGVFCVGYNLVAGLRKSSQDTGVETVEKKVVARFDLAKIIPRSQQLPVLAGIIALIAVLLFGNLYLVREFWYYLPEAAGDLNTPDNHTGSVFAGAVQVLTGVAKLPGDKARWYFEPSRPILHNGPDTPIAEFPYFTFLYADMHPHLLTMPLYSLALGWMLSVLLHSLSKRNKFDLVLCLLLSGLIFGSFRAAHTWDFPTFIGMGTMVILWDTWRNRTGSIKQTFQAIIGYELVFFGIAVALFWPFARWFQTEYASLKLWDGLRTPLIDYLFVFGLSLFVMISLLGRDLIADVKSCFHQWRSSLQKGFFNREYRLSYGLTIVAVCVMVWLWVKDYQVLAFGLPIIVGITYLIFLKRELPILRRVIWLLYGIGLAITFLVEVIVLKGDTGRSNTVFRFYNQAWFIIGIAMSAAVVELLAELPSWPRRYQWIWLPVLGLLTLSAASYPLIATGKKMADRWPGIQNPPHTLDGAAFMLGEANDPSGQAPAIYDDESRKFNLSLDYVAIQYMQDHITGSPVIVEGNTQEYRWGSRFSIYTGLPSVVGWSWHVRQHNSLLDGALIEKRINEVNDFYNTPDIQAAIQFLHRYQVGYIIVGDLERGYYSAEGIGKFQKMIDQGIVRVVFGNNSPNTTTVFEVKDAR
jgi:YYY domain-containing protein